VEGNTIQTVTVPVQHVVKKGLCTWQCKDAPTSIFVSRERDGYVGYLLQIFLAYWLY